MGLSVTASHVIWFVAILGISGVALGAFFGVSNALQRAEVERRAIDAERLDAFLGNLTFCYDGAFQRLVVSGTNLGHLPLDLSNLTFLVDGNVTTGFAAVTQDTGTTTSLWGPGEWANFTLATATEPKTIALATAHGAQARATKLVCPYLASIVVSPPGGTIPVAGTQDFAAAGYDQYGNPYSAPSFAWTATGGTITPLTSTTARYAAGTTAGTYALNVSFGSVYTVATLTLAPLAPSTVTVSPAAVVVPAGGTQAFVATAKDVYGNVNGTAGVTWSTNAGAVSSSGVLTAQTTAQSGLQVTATSGSASGQASVDVDAAAPASVAVSPSSVTVQVGGRQAFVATVTDAYGNVNATAPVSWSATAGSVTSGGSYTAPTTSGSATVTATSGSAQGTSSVTLSPGAPSAVAVSPASVTVTAGGSQAFVATVTDAYGNVNATAPVSWSTNAGTITSGGTLTAQTTAASGLSATATSGGKSGSATVTVAAGAPTSVTVSPASATIAAGSTLQLSATLKDQYGNVNTTASVSWSASAGSITSGGLLTGSTVAPSTTTVTATSGGVSGTSTVSVQPGAPSSVALAPASATVLTTHTQAFSATVKDQYGNMNTTATVSWSATRGSVASDGTYTAPTTTGADTVTATAGGKSGSATVTVQQKIHASNITTYNGASLATTFARGQTVTVRVTVQDQDGRNLGSITTFYNVTSPAGTKTSFSPATNAGGVSFGNLTIPSPSANRGTWSIALSNVQGADANTIYDAADPRSVTTQTFTAT